MYNVMQEAVYALSFKNWIELNLWGYAYMQIRDVVKISLVGWNSEYTLPIIHVGIPTKGQLV